MGVRCLYTLRDLGFYVQVSDYAKASKSTSASLHTQEVVLSSGQGPALGVTRWEFYSQLPPLTLDQTGYFSERQLLHL